MNPTPGDAHVNTPLTMISIAYMQDTNAFVSQKVFPVVPVMKQSDLYWRYDRGDFNRNEAQLRAAAAESAGGGYKIDATASYSAPIVAFHKDISDQFRANADSMINADRDATNFVTQKLLIYREKDWVSQFFTSGKWTNDYTGVASGPTGSQTIQWDQYGTSDPINDVSTAATAIQQLTGFRPNTLVIGRQVWDKLKNHPDLVDRIKYGQTSGGPAIITRQAVAALFEIDRLFVMDSIENTGNEQAGFESNMTHVFIGGKKALLCYAAPAPSLMAPSAGYTFSWVDYLGANLGTEGNRIKKFRMEHLASDRVEGEIAFSNSLIGADLGFFWNSIIG